MPPQVSILEAVAVAKTKAEMASILSTVRQMAGYAHDHHLWNILVKVEASGMSEASMAYSTIEWV